VFSDPNCLAQDSIKLQEDGVASEHDGQNNLGHNPLNINIKNL